MRASDWANRAEVLNQPTTSPVNVCYTIPSLARHCPACKLSQWFEHRTLVSGTQIQFGPNTGVTFPVDYFL